MPPAHRSKEPLYANGHGRLDDGLWRYAAFWTSHDFRPLLTQSGLEVEAAQHNERPCRSRAWLASANQWFTRFATAAVGGSPYIPSHSWPSLLSIVSSSCCVNGYCVKISSVC